MCKRKRPGGVSNTHCFHFLAENSTARCFRKSEYPCFRLAGNPRFGLPTFPLPQDSVLGGGASTTADVDGFSSSSVRVGLSWSCSVRRCRSRLDFTLNPLLQRPQMYGLSPVWQNATGLRLSKGRRPRIDYAVLSRATLIEVQPPTHQISTQVVKCIDL